MSHYVKLRDARLGPVSDFEGGRWTRTEAGAVFHSRDGDVPWAAEDFDEADEHFGPFLQPAAPGRRSWFARLFGGGA